MKAWIIARRIKTLNRPSNHQHDHRASMPFLLGVLLAMSSCGLAAPDVDAYSGVARHDGELAIVDNWSDCAWCVSNIARDGYLYFSDDRDGPAKHIKLVPGTYRITYAWRSYKGSGAGHSSDVHFEAGHVYVVKTAVCMGGWMWGPGCYSPYPNWVWIEDTTIGQVVSGEPRPADFGDPIAEQERAQATARGHGMEAASKHVNALTVAAACGDTTAQFDLATEYLAGRGPTGRPDRGGALALYDLAARNGHPTAASVRDRLARELTGAERVSGVVLPNCSSQH